MSALRIERLPGSGPAPAAFAALASATAGGRDDDPVPGGAERWLAWRGDAPAARLSTEVVHGLRGVPGAAGLVGHYEAADAGAGTALLRAACDALSGGGAERVLGPMNGSTWRRYRLALPPRAGESQPDPPWFLSEPQNPPDYPAHFEAAGFAAVAHYESRIESPIDAAEASRREARERLAAKGFTIRDLDTGRFEEALRGFWELSLASFAENPYYTPIGLDDFLALYRPLRSRIDPGLVLLAHDSAGRLAGFMLGFPDALSDRGAGPTRVVCKSVAVAPGARGLGLGGFLLSEVRARGRVRGHTAAIDALIHVSNVSRHMSMGHASKVFRRYALYGWSTVNPARTGRPV